MKAQSLAICVLNKGCNKNCPYCISKLTGYDIANADLIERNTNKVVKLATTASVSSVILTGKGEPLLNIDAIDYFGDKFVDFPIEVQTNGALLLQNKRLIKTLYNCNVNVVAFSFDNIAQFEQFTEIIEGIQILGMVARVTFNVTDGYMSPEVATKIDLSDFITQCKQVGVSQLSFRNITIPHNFNSVCATTEAWAAYSWIMGNTQKSFYYSLVHQLTALDANLIRSLAFGAKVYDVDGIAVTYFDYCLQDNHKEEDIRSLIFGEDGHCYSTWNSKASILF